MKIIVDSSVIVSAIRPDQVFHTASLEFLNLIRDRGDEVWVPMTMLWEIGSALSHRGKAPAGTKFNKTFDVDLRYIVIDEGLFQRTWTGNTRVPTIYAWALMSNHAHLLLCSGALG
jgi:predicted nucleic acid-binding protein